MYATMQCSCKEINFEVLNYNDHLQTAPGPNDDDQS